jgi:hypothetical protein
MPGGFRLKLVLTRLSSFGQEWRRVLGQSAQAREKLFVCEAVEIVDVEIDVLRQQRGNHLEIGSRALDPDPLDCLGPMPLEIRRQCLDEVLAQLVSRAFRRAISGVIAFLTSVSRVQRLL